ncbi:MAG TPA: hypothetical protein VNA68_01660, partial [Candidatus Dormibacteraeota bacterium]|nr:hypothetical protein [Candidatus Dormibacteraeota bacterium]
ITFDKRWSAIWRAKDIMCSLGLFEVSTYSFISEKQIADIGAKPAGHLKLKNPLSSEQAYLRSDLLPSLLKTAERNRSYSREFGVFEFSRVYVSRGEGKLPAEPLRLGVLIRTEAGGYKSAKRALDCLAREFNLQISITPQAFGTMAHPANAAVIKAGTEVIGLLCQLHPVLTKRHKISAEIGYLEVDWDRLMSAVIPRVYREASRYPSIERDIAIVLKSDINWNKIEQGINASELASAEFLSDYYGSDLPKGHKSLAIRLHFQSMDRTLTDKEAEAGEKKVLALLKKRFGAAPRK